MFAASNFGLFEKLGSHRKTLEELSSELKLPERSLRILADSMVALGLLKKEDNRYFNTEESSLFLSGSESDGLRPFLKFWDRVSYKKWTTIQQTVSGKTLFGEYRLTPEEQQIFSEGIESITNSVAQLLPEVFDFSAHNALLDLGGGTGSYLIPILNKYSRMNITLCELPQVARIARKKLTSFGDHLRILDCDIQKDSIPEGHDVVLIANVMHIFSPERNCKLLSAIRKKTPDQAKLLLIDFWTDSTHTKPVLSALLAAEFLNWSGQGDTYSVEEVSDWLSQTGWKFMDHRELYGPFSLIVAS